MKVIPASFRCNRPLLCQRHVGDMAVVAAIAQRIIGVPRGDALLAEHRAAGFAVLARLLCGGSGSAETDANCHSLTVRGARDRSGQLITTAFLCTPMPAIAYVVPYSGRWQMP